MSAHPLTYDTLPPHSRLQREFVDGVLKITAMPEEPGPLVRRAAMIRAAPAAAIIFLVAMVIGVMLFGATYAQNRRFLSFGLSVALMAAFVTFCAALFALVWSIQYAARMDSAERALQQTTILAASIGRLIIESTGPAGSTSVDLKDDGSHSIQRLRVTRSTAPGQCDCLEVICADGSIIRILAGRDPVELNWVACSLISVLQECS